MIFLGQSHSILCLLVLQVTVTDSSSDLDTESTGSFFHDKSTTFGSLIGVSSVLELSGKSVRGRKAEPSRSKKSYLSKTCFSSLCSKASINTENMKYSPSLGHFLEVERRAATDYGRNLNPMIYEPNEFVEARPVVEPNSSC